MRRYVKIIFIATLSVFLSSCYTIIFNSLGILDKTVVAKKANNSDKQIVFIPMHHIGKKEFYANVKRKIDSLRNAGYTLYFEGTKFSQNYDSLRNDTLAMKLRKIVGLDMRALKSNGGYIDTLNNSLMGIKIKAIAKHDLINQPKNNVLFDSLTDRRVDIYLSDAMLAFEEKFGPVILNRCDFDTKYNAKYSCKKYKSKEGKRFIIVDYRNSFVANEVMKDLHTKIAIIYGAKHFEGIIKELKQKDSTWKIIGIK